MVLNDVPYRTTGQNDNPISVAILAGGKSTRMGVDKAMVRLRDNGPTLIEHVIQQVAWLSEDCFIVASGRPEYAGFGLQVHSDQYPDAGPLGGIGTGLAIAKHDRCLVVSCDHPFLERALLQTLVDDRRAFDILIPVLSGTSRQGGAAIRQTLHAIYRSTCVEPIERAILEGRLQVVSFFPEVQVLEIDEVTIRQTDPNLRSFFSVNTPDALRQARDWELFDCPNTAVLT